MAGEHASISTLPLEMIERILSKVNPNDIIKMQYVCTQWRNILRRRRHIMRRLEVTSIYIYDVDVLTVLISHNTYHSDQKRTTIKLPDYTDLFDCLWIYAPRSLIIDASKNSLRKSLEAMPDWWFQDIRELELFENACDLDVLALLSRCPRCFTIEIDPCFTIDNVTSLLHCMKQLVSFKIRKCNNTVIADDSTIDVLIPLSQVTYSGLNTFWVDAISTDFTLQKMFEFFEKGKFHNIFTFFVERVRGSDEEFQRWLLSHAQWVNVASHLVYHFVYRDVEFSVEIGYYAS